MKKLLFACLVATAFAAQAETKWDLPSGYAANTFHTQNLEQFAKDVNASSAGKLMITVHPGASLFKQPEIKRAIQTGLVPMGEFIISGQSNENPLFGVDSIPFLATSYVEARKLYDAARPVQQKVLAGQGLKLLYSVPWPGQSLYSVSAINGPDDLKGSKMRTYNPATTKIAQMLGAAPVTIQLPELGQALATGAVQNFLTSSASGVDSKLYEQTKFFYPVNAWYPRNVVAVSQKAFDGLDKATQEAVLKAASAAETRGWQASEKNDADSLQVLQSNGMTIAQPSEALRKELRRIGETMTSEWLAVAGPDGKAIIDAYRK
ncbi:MAG: C4-dicarboxylate ABC transporter substrate-binding protein [Candidatus Accumulibacter meliphilus]|jgi:TRAP-type C4-dicarboxylate transport system substrate-binding protein|uniref:C4-dicarboxylate ABC transporter substrate-binding protein n=1 Tax=Candidatus Accumulibacter meliphilus TaxID=2211374 RepID=A0A369XFN1_9PROT|nr:MAG: C4-dicarboxylate ABC transporter substrate-binding protein [Candidatus Accumulibacter meliphilus]